MSWITVQTKENDTREEDQMQAKRLEKAIRSLKGVIGVEAEGDDPAYVLEEIGQRLWQLEDMKSLDCPLRDMRQQIESTLKKEFRNNTPKRLEDTLSGQCDWCAKHRCQ